MSAVVCGSKRSFFEDLPPSPPVSKRLRCSSSTSPIRFSAPSLIDQLRAVFPRMDVPILENALQECGNDLDAAIKRLHELCLASADENSGIAEETVANEETVALKDEGNASASENQSAPNNIPADGAGWIDLFVREMMGATTIDDARARAARILEVLEKTIKERVTAEALVIQEENTMLKENIKGLNWENGILRQGVKALQQRKEELDSKNNELQHLRQVVSQYQEQLRKLEVDNYALRMHLSQAQQCNSFPGRFPPDVF